MTVREFITLMSKPEHAHLLDCEMEFEESLSLGGDVSPINHVSVVELREPDDIDFEYDKTISLSNVWKPAGTRALHFYEEKRTNLTEPKEQL